MPAVERPDLRVEGNDDAHVIKHLLRQHGCLCPIKGERAREDWSDNAPTITPVGDVDSLIQGMELVVRLNGGRAVGFVLDADEEATDRWYEVCNRIDSLQLPVPDRIPIDGYVGVSPINQARVGVWLMPDNRERGALEAFLSELGIRGDTIFPIAKRSTIDAKRAGALFPDNKRDKAIIRAWLAWQEEPGLPYGLAVSKHYFRHDSILATRFVEWFKRVFECGSGSDALQSSCKDVPLR
jgi:hypothetical protein